MFYAQSTAVSRGYMRANGGGGGGEKQIELDKEMELEVEAFKMKIKPALFQICSQMKLTLLKRN